MIDCFLFFKPSKYFHEESKEEKNQLASFKEKYGTFSGSIIWTINEMIISVLFINWALILLQGTYSSHLAILRRSFRPVASTHIITSLEWSKVDWPADEQWLNLCVSWFCSSANVGCHVVGTLQTSWRIISVFWANRWTTKIQDAMWIHPISVNAQRWHHFLMISFLLPSSPPCVSGTAGVRGVLSFGFSHKQTRSGSY